MPGPVSDSRDPQFGTAANREIVEEASKKVITKLTREVLHDERLLPIVELCSQPNAHSKLIQATLKEREWRIIRFALRNLAGLE